MLALPLSVMAMDAVTNSELEGVSGQAGVTIGFGGTTTTTTSFDQLSWGDTDGFGTCGSDAGWLVINGTITIDQIIADGQLLTLDVGTTTAADCSPGADAVVIPTSGTTFIAVGLPTVKLSIDTPETLGICLGTAAGSMDSTLGLLNLANLSVDAGTPDTLYIWAH